MNLLHIPLPSPTPCCSARDGDRRWRFFPGYRVAAPVGIVVECAELYSVWCCATLSSWAREVARCWARCSVDDRTAGEVDLAGGDRSGPVGCGEGGDVGEFVVAGLVV